MRSQPNVFYVGYVNGGVWKSDDFGRVWTPIFDGYWIRSTRRVEADDKAGQATYSWPTVELRAGPSDGARLRVYLGQVPRTIVQNVAYRPRMFVV